MKKKLLLLLTLFVLFQCSAMAWWKNQTPTGFTSTLFSVVISDETTAAAVGANGKLLRTSNSGATWTTSYINGTSYTWYGLKRLAPNNLYAVGTKSSIGYLYGSTNGGNSWTEVYSSTNISAYKAIDLYDTTHGFMGGSNAAGKSYNGSYYKISKGGWEDVLVCSTQASIYGVAFPSATTCFAVGNYSDASNPGIYKSTTSGETWVALTNLASVDIYAIHAVTQTKVWVAGNNGTVLYTTNGGTSWTSQNTGIDPSHNLRSIYFYDSFNGYIVGLGGLIFTTTNGGTSWTKLDSPTTSNLYCVKGIYNDANNAWAVGGSNGVILKQGNDPTLTSITTNTAFQGEDKTVTIIGTNFRVGLNTSSLNLGAGITVNTLTRNSETNLTATLSIAPSATPGSRNLTITNPDSGTATLTGAFTVQAHAPVINTFLPTATYVGSTCSVVITGNYFDPAVNFTFSKATVNSITDVTTQSATVNITANTTGTCTITAVNPDLQVGTKEGFYINDPSLPSPVLTSVTPNTGVVGTSLDLVVAGLNLPTTLATANVYFPDDALITVDTITPVSSTRLDLRISINTAAPTGIPKALTVRDTSTGNAGSIDFTAQPASGTAPTVTELVPGTLYVTADASAASAAAIGNSSLAAATTATETIMVNGTDFDAAPTVSITSTIPGKTIPVVSLVRLSSTQLQAAVQPSFSLTGTYNVTVMNSTGLTGTLASALTVIQASADRRLAEMPLVYPNPCHSFPVTLQFRFKNDIDEATFYIVDIKGRLQKKFTISNIKAGEYVHYQFDGQNSWRHGLANGIYKIRIKDSQGFFQDKGTIAVLQ
jgi:photosystem II stability/assembly factor-like uncharacterized protein